MKNWFQKNRWLGMFLSVFGPATSLSLVFLLMARIRFDSALARFNDTASERSRLEHLDPFPSDANYQEMKHHLEKYHANLDKLKAELRAHSLAAPPLAPNEFQTRLRQAMTTTSERARIKKVKLPDDFALGFDEFTTSLPNSVAASLLGQELAQIQLLLSVLIEAPVDELTVFWRLPLPEEHPTVVASGGKPAKTGTSKADLLARGVLDLTFVAAPAATRKVINQIAANSEQFYVIRALHVRNENDKGPPRDEGSVSATRSAERQIRFIVGNEHLETSAKIEIVTFPLEAQHP